MPIFKSLKKSKSSLFKSDPARNPRLTNPSRDWVIGLFIFVLSAMSISLLSWQQFTSYQNMDVFEHEQTLSFPRYNEAEIKASINKFSAINDKYRLLKQDIEDLRSRQNEVIIMEKMSELDIDANITTDNLLIEEDFSLDHLDFIELDN